MAGAPPYGVQQPGQGAAPMVPAGAHGPIGNTRNPFMTLVLSMCFIYGIFAAWTMLNELKAFRQKEDINPIMLFVPILNIIMIWGLPEKVLDAKRMAGVPNPTVQSPILYLFLWLYFLPGDLNEIFQAAGGQAPGGAPPGGAPPGGMPPGGMPPGAMPPPGGMQ